VPWYTKKAVTRWRADIPCVAQGEVVSSFAGKEREDVGQGARLEDLPERRHTCARAIGEREREREAATNAIVKARVSKCARDDMAMDACTGDVLSKVDAAVAVDVQEGKEARRDVGIGQVQHTTYEWMYGRAGTGVSQSARHVDQDTKTTAGTGKEGAYLQNSWKETSPERSVSIAMNCVCKPVVTNCETTTTTAMIESYV
jgi:hypothetical protein